jgi:TPR repeat protein
LGQFTTAGDTQFNLGLMYDNGAGVPQDYVQAHLWFNLAASHLAKVQERNSAASARDALAKRMTPEQIAEAQRLARDWKPKQ